MKTINVMQGSEEWLALRGKYRAASEAPIVMNASSKMTRAALVRMKASGGEREFSEWVKRELLEKGHEIEAAARPIAEAIIGEELFPVTGVDDSGYLLASFDGLTMGEDTGWECKSWNEAKAAAVRAGSVPEEDYWQVLQQLAVGAERVLYMVTDGTPEKTVHVWATIDKDDRKLLLACWRLFDEEVANYQHVEPAPEPVAETIIALPALTIQVDGRVVTSNLVAFKKSADDFIAKIKTDLKTDVDFANAEKQIKFCKEAEDRLELVKRQALAQTVSIDEVFRTMDAIRDDLRAKRLDLDKTVTRRKEAIRFEVKKEGEDALAAHVAELNKGLGKPYMPTIPADFASAMKGKKTVTSLRDAVSTELSRAKMVASETATRIQINLNTLRELAADFAFLFADTGTIVLKQPDDLAMLVKARIADHKAAEQAKAEAARKAEAERLEREQAEAARKAEAERIASEQAEQQRRAQEEQQRQAQAQAQQQAPAAAPATETPTTVATAVMPAPAGDLFDAAPAPAPKPTRPNDGEIIVALALHFRVHESQVIAWLMDMDLKAASARMAEEFAA